MRVQAPMDSHAFHFSQQPDGTISEQVLSQFAEAVGNYLVSNKLEFGGYEPYVDEEVVARFVGITSRRVLEMARDGEIPAHPIGSGSRKTWRFRLSEIEAHFSSKKNSTGATLNSAVPGATRRKQ